jgi:glyceraldehyde-3-phosphate dehydrogenase type I
MTTIHAYTNDQNLTDVYHTDPYRARSATQNMIPSKTGAAEAVGLVLPELAGKLTGMAVRVPVINVSLVDLTVQLKKEATADEVNALLKEASQHSKISATTPCRWFPATSTTTAVVDLRRQPHQIQRQTAEGAGLVRQRMGLLQPHAG